MVSGPAARSTNINTPFRPRSLLGRGPPSVAREGIAAAGGPCPSGNTDSVSLVTPSQQTSDIMSVRRRLGEKQVYDIIFCTDGNVGYIYTLKWNIFPTILDERMPGGRARELSFCNSVPQAFPSLCTRSRQGITPPPTPHRALVLCRAQSRVCDPVPRSVSLSRNHLSHLPMCRNLQSPCTNPSPVPTHVWVYWAACAPAAY